MLAVAVACLVALTPLVGPTAPAGAQGAPAPAFTSGDGITVLGTTSVDARTWDVRLRSPLISDGPTAHGNGVRVLLPEGYQPRSAKRYPVLYLLHGATGSYKTWHQDVGPELARFAGSDLIVVMPEGGRIGMYTNWVDQSKHRQDWLTFHLDQLVPFIDRNLKTIPEARSRAIAGVSMGGGGAFRYTFERPDLFGTVASFSGAVNPHSPLFAAALPAMTTYWGLPAYGQYGLPFWPFWNAWRSANPMGHAQRFRGVTTLLFVGKGTDPAEHEMRMQAEGMSAALTRAGVPHTFVNYGAPGDGCDGGHTPGCAGYGLRRAMPQIRAGLSLPPG